ncbi:nucleotide disphospho-sugar-binding domain-containing protein [Streptosporangium sp. NPDC051022]|uniref:nucleotide disphospho-sugar-binding domain-containing protein n=1 Tax=Streptosporangium sp. NPDC051022 TaxID=3155752 RepID=UPI003438A153
MRVLFTTSPGLGHMFPVVSLAWALRAAGHEILVATAGRREGHVQAMADAGLPVVEALTAVEANKAFAAGIVSWMRDEGRGVAGTREWPRTVGRELARNGGRLETVARMYGPLSASMAGEVVSVAERWRPDLVVHTPLEGAGPLAAAKLGVPAVEQPIGFSRNEGVAPVLRGAMDEVYRAHGVSGPPERRAALSVAPRSMTGEVTGVWPMRYVPYNGGGVQAGWLRVRPDRPRVALTLGSVVVNWHEGLGPLSWVAEVAGNVDAEFVLALGDDVDPARLGRLPENVWPAGYVPLTQLLATCSASVHHGGSGSTMASLDAGIPQLILPRSADQFVNADAVVGRGCGLATEDVVDTGLIVRLLSDERPATAAAQVRAEMRAMPSPAEVVPRLVELAG